MSDWERDVHAQTQALYHTRTLIRKQGKRRTPRLYKIASRAYASSFHDLGIYRERTERGHVSSYDDYSFSTLECFFTFVCDNSSRQIQINISLVCVRVRVGVSMCVYPSSSVL